jgi:hypothetical protein
LENLAEECVDLDLPRIGVVRLVTLQEVFETAVFECLNGQHGNALRSRKFTI